MVKFLVALEFVHHAGIFEKYALIVLITYLTDVWGLGLIHAAGLINLWIGTTNLMPFAFLFVIDNYVRNSYYMLIFSTTASGLGMGLLSISTPSWLYSRVTGVCSEQTMKCIDDTQQLLFYIALIFIMIGKSTREATMQTIQFKGNAIQRELTKSLVTSIDKKYTVMYVLLFSVIQSWSIRFGVSAVCSFVALYLLKGKSWACKLDINSPERSPVTTVLRVFVASVVKLFKCHSYGSSGTYKDIEKEDPSLRYSSSFRLSENAEIQSPTKKYSRRSWVHCSYREVEDIKTLARLLPVGVVFVFLGLISSMGNTFFVIQGVRLKSPVSWFKYLGLLKLLSIHEFSKNQFGRYTREDFLAIMENPHSAQLIAAIVYAIPCCLVAAVVEIFRLNVISKHGLENISMTTFWLIPQFLLLGIVDGMTERSMDMFFMREMPRSMRNYGILVSNGLVGLGTISSMLFVYVVGNFGKVSQPRWFQHSMESSRLDLFYWLLLVLCVAVFVIWVVLSVRVTFAWNTLRPLNYNPDDITKLLEPGRDVKSIKDGEVADQMVEAVIVEYLVTKWRKRIVKDYTNLTHLL